MMKPCVLLVDDDEGFLDMLHDELAETFQISRASSAEEALGAAEVGSFDAVVTDIKMRGMTGLDLARKLSWKKPDLPIVLLTAFGDMDSAVEAMRAGARDFLTKPVDVSALAYALRRATRESALAREVERLRSLAGHGRGIDEIVTQCDAMRPIVELIVRVAPTTTTLLVTGESGTGKELVARAVHALGLHPLQQFVAVNCAAIPEALVEAELFGYEKGAFTGAHAARRGLLVEAGHGTIFLDEIAELPLALQPKLLRALQERAVRRLGGNREEPFEARIVVATNRNLADEVAAGRFRQDLYYRLNVVEVALPPLRSRGNDVLLLAQHFIEAHAARLKKDVKGLSAEAAERLLAHRWPGNVRELENCIERAVTLARGPQLVPSDLPPALLAAEASPAPSRDLLQPGDDLSALPTLEELELKYIRQVLDAVSGNKTLAAKVLGVDRRTLYRKLGPQADES